MICTWWVTVVSAHDNYTLTLTSVTDSSKGVAASVSGRITLETPLVLRWDLSVLAHTVHYCETDECESDEDEPVCTRD